MSSQVNTRTPTAPEETRTVEEIPDGLLEADAMTRARQASELAARYGAVIAELSRIRREALNELVASGMNQTAIGRELGMSRSRVGQLLGTGPRPERALIAQGPITVAIGGKVENRDRGGDPSAVVSQESLAAYHVIQDLAGSYQLDCGYELVPPPGMLDLNRDSLVVIGSPRLLPLVGQVMESDPNHVFKQGARGWFLFDRANDKTLRSPADSGESADYAWLGRLPTPSGNGSFLYLAGIHAMGTIGAAHYLADHVEDLYKQVRTKRWSVIIRSNYDPDTREVTSTEAVTPVSLA